MTTCRLILDAPQAGDWNMAVDEVLLDAAAAAGACCLRLYRWLPATLSLGYFQQYEDRHGHEASRGCPVVRRASGGGAIVHDREWTYSLTVPAGHPLAARRLALYRAVHATLVEILGDLGLTASLCPKDAAARAGRPPFLCFQRRSEGDVLAGPHKVAGSAQRRRAGAVLQHGSVLLARSAAAPELPGIGDLRARPVDESAFAAAWLERLGRRLSFAWDLQPLTDRERQLADQSMRSKYGTSPWTECRGR